MLAVEASTATIWVAAIAAVASIVAGFFAMAGADLKATLSSRDRVFKPADPDIIRIVAAPT